MLSLTDFREKQILFVESTDIKDISFLNENFTIKKEGKIVQQVPFHKIFSVFVVGNCTLTSTFIKKTLEFGAVLVLMDLNLKVYAIIGGETEGNVLLREKQYSFADDFKKAKWIVANKIRNQQQLLKNIRKKTSEEKQAIQSLSDFLEKAEVASDPKGLLGIEGNASRVFFGQYFLEFDWRGRKPRTKYDEINVLLDIGYTYLFHFLDAHLRLYGFDTYRGFYHTEFYQRKSLVCDMVEPFRCIIDLALKNAFARNQYDPKDFEVKYGKYKLKRGCGKKYTKIFLEAIMERKEEIFLFVQTYYRAVMKDDRDFPVFKL